MRVRLRYWLPGGCAAGSAQDLWLKNDLATAPTNNIIAMWHKPRWSSSGSMTHMQQLWQDLYDGGADIVLGGHWHNYERFAPMNASRHADPTFGVRQFVVGTGGAALTGFGTILPTSEVRNSSTYGVMKFTLHASSYDWQFVPIAGQTFTDSGTAPVHAAPVSHAGNVHDHPRHGLHRREAAVQALAVQRDLVGGAAHDRGVTSRDMDLAAEQRTTPGATSSRSRTTPTCRPTPRRLAE